MASEVAAEEEDSSGAEPRAPGDGGGGARYQLCNREFQVLVRVPGGQQLQQVQLLQLLLRGVRQVHQLRGVWPGTWRRTLAGLLSQASLPAEVRN